MLINFIYFYKKDKKNISENAEKLTNEVLKFLGKEKEDVKLKEYPSYDYIIKNLEADSGTSFIDFEFKNRNRIAVLLNKPSLYFEVSVTFSNDSYYIQIGLLEDDLKLLGEKNDIIEQKIIDFNKKIIEKNGDIEAAIYLNEYGIHNLNYGYNLTKTKNNTQEVKEWITNMFFRKGEKIYFEKGDLDIYGKNRITGY